MEYTVAISVILAVLGLIFGSFAGASLWRLRARQLRLDAQAGEKVPASARRQVAKLKPQSVRSDRSVCLHCGHTLRWYDLLPLASWVSLGGKCRYCRKPIGWFEPAVELGLAAFFVVSYLFWPSPLLGAADIAQFVIWLIAGVGLTVLFAYDMKWYLLPNAIVFPLIGLGALNALIVLAEARFAGPAVLSVLVSCAVLSGLYYVLYVASRGKWVGFGDIKLGLALALLLADWQLAVLALFLANLIGTIVFLPFLLSGKIERQAHIPFGPLLIAGWAIAGLFGARIVSWYVALTLGV